MNKKYIIMTALAAMALVSCDMDKEPYNSLPDSEALQTPRNFPSAAVQASWEHSITLLRFSATVSMP